MDREAQRGLMLESLATKPRSDRSLASLFRTVDGGRSWSEERLPATSVFRDQFNIRMGRDRGAVFTDGCDLYASHDLGASWEKAQTGALKDYLCGEESLPYSLRFVEPQEAWLRTYGGWILNTDDGGIAWRVSSLGRRRLTASEALGDNDWISFSTGSRGLMIADGQVLVTEDGGRRWVEPSDNADENFWSVSCADSKCVLVSNLRVASYTFEQ